ncbi:MAG: ribonuclease III [Peptococcaceae bacterium]|jgi:ribonuclease-3 family protein|nr:ribonuclease III [Peptococcaceae bacterium]
MLWFDPAMDAERLAPLVLAYVGDAVFELYVRGHLAVGRRKVGRLHCRVVKLVSARAMAGFYKTLEPRLTPTEAAVLRRGRNAKSKSVKSAALSEYHMSTGFEALVGYLFLSRQEERLGQLLAPLLEAAREIEEKEHDV